MIMKTKNDFTMWLFRKEVLKTLNWILVILAVIWLGYHLIKAIF